MARRIDEACRRFEADWRSARGPCVEDYLNAYSAKPVAHCVASWRPWSANCATRRRPFRGSEADPATARPERVEVRRLLIRAGLFPGVQPPRH